MKTIIHKSADRGHANHGWLNSYHTFSFAGFYNPDQMNFGALRVLNDDTVTGGMGFGKHPHDNMEIISIPLEGALEHQDDIGNKAVITQGEVQIMSAGTGVFHSERNHSMKDPVKFLQIWVFPDKQAVTPRYEQLKFDVAERVNRFQTVVSPIDSSDEGVKIHQQSWFSLVDLDAETELDYSLNRSENGVYFFVLEGEASIGNADLSKRDGIGISEVSDVRIKTRSTASILAIEVPMRF
jgi:redox-sensitive bicupin YhaK (pirin superfamily)